MRPKRRLCKADSLEGGSDMAMATIACSNKLRHSQRLFSSFSLVNRGSHLAQQETCGSWTRHCPGASRHYFSGTALCVSQQLASADSLIARPSMYTLRAQTCREIAARDVPQAAAVATAPGRHRVGRARGTATRCVPVNSDAIVASQRVRATAPHDRRTGQVHRLLGCAAHAPALGKRPHRSQRDK
jgi:hypothetical protein